MSERLENFIRNHRKQFDDIEAPDDLWYKIEQGLDLHDKEESTKRQSLRKGTILKVAATIIFVISAGLGMWIYKKNNVVNISSIDPQLAKQEYHYTALIEEKRRELKQIKKEDPELYKEFSSEVKSIDENYQKLKKDLQTSPNQEETVKAMIRNLQIQIQVLNQQLQIIEQVNQFKKGKKHENRSI